MPLQFHVARGTVVLCDYNSGFREPEMVKRRPVVVISHRLPHRNGLCTVVPLSTTPPPHPVPYSCRVTFDKPLPERFHAPEMWAKADMLATVGFGRLDLFRGPRLSTGARQYIHPKVTPEQLAEIEICILHALGLHRLTPRN